MTESLSKPVSATVNYVCSICGRSFARNTHLRRHEAGHRGRRHACQSCHKTFARSDVARRHMRSCSLAANKEPTAALKPGRKIQACDQCAKGKLACDKLMPCRRCSSQKLFCTYQRCRDLNTHPSSQSFLLHMTNPTPRTTANILASENPTLSSLPLLSDTRLLVSQEATDWTSFESLFWGYDQSIQDLHVEGWLLHEPLSCPSSGGPVDSNQDSHNLQLRLNALVVEFSNFDYDEGSSGEQYDTRTRQFFAVQNFIDLVETFFRLGQSRWPIIHWPTFSPYKASSVLLLSIMAAGTALSQPSCLSVQETLLTSKFCEKVEAFIFSRVPKTTLLYQQDATKREALETCQAGLLIETIQASENDTKTRRRIVTQRHPVLVTAVRALVTAEKNTISPLETPSWAYFISQESTVRIATWTFLADAIQSLALCRPTVMVLSEMNGPLPCEDGLWDADTELGFEAAWRSISHVKHQKSIRDLMEALLADEWTITHECLMSGLKMRELYIMLWALQPVILTLRATLLSSTFVPALGRILQRWHRLWDRAASRMGRVQQQVEGPERHALELARLTAKIFELQQSSEVEKLPYFDGIPRDSTKELHDIITSYL